MRTAKLRGAMAKKRTSAQQASLFKQEIPEMLEGYYSSGPNPNLRRFVEEHAALYDPETDDYDVPPFDQPITTTKATVIYNMHTYWSKKPHDAIRQYIRHYTQPGDLVLDPMCGSGGTALAALMEGRAAIAGPPSSATRSGTWCWGTSSPRSHTRSRSGWPDRAPRVRGQVESCFHERAFGVKSDRLGDLRGDLGRLLPSALACGPGRPVRPRPSRAAAAGPAPG